MLLSPLSPFTFIFSHPLLSFFYFSSPLILSNSFQGPNQSPLKFVIQPHACQIKSIKGELIFLNFTQNQLLSLPLSFKLQNQIGSEIRCWDLRVRSVVDVLALPCIFCRILCLLLCVCSSTNNFLFMSFSVYFVVGWLKFGGKEKKEEPLLPARWDSSFGFL